MRPLVAPPAPPGKFRRRRRPGRKPPGNAPPPSPERVIAESQRPRPTAVPVDVPLSPAESARMKANFQFLREHRHLLKLRLNAAEDLLLNGVREPTHRGVCQHLLAKVERARVLSVSERLAPAEGMRLLAGILRFAPEIPYIVRFLECVQKSSSQKQAAAALTEALKHIDLAETSNAQMRQILALIVEIFPERELPLFLLSLFGNRRFREAFERSSADLPDAVAGIALPLYAVHEAVVRPGHGGRHPRHDPRDLEVGVALLFRIERQSLLELPEPTRRRLVELGATPTALHAGVDLDALVGLFRSLSWSNDGERAVAAQRLASGLLAAGHEGPARKLLLGAPGAKDPGSVAGRWLRSLEGPRFGSVALDPPRGGRPNTSDRSAPELPGPGRWYRGIHLPSQRPVRIRYGEPSEREEYARHIALIERLLVPGVVRLIAAGAEPGERPYVAVALPGHSLARELGRSSGPGESARTALELCALFAATAYAGVALPDGDIGRFSVDDAGRVWLLDLWAASAAAPEAALGAHLGFAKHACGALFGGPARGVPAAPWGEDAVDFAELAARLERA